MMVTVGICMRRWQRVLRKFFLDPRVHMLLQAGGCLASGWALSAASLGGYAQPFALGLLSAMSGWPGVLCALGGGAGYLLFWGKAGLQGLIWMAAGLPAALLCSRSSGKNWLLPAISGAIAALTGLAVQLLFHSGVPILMYFLRIAVAALSSLLFCRGLERQDSVVQWLEEGIGVLALAQIAPLPWLDFGILAAGFLTASGAFPAAALAGLALDLSRITPVPMTAVLCLGYMIRLIPGLSRYVKALAAGLVFLPVTALCGVSDLPLLPGLLLGGAASLWLPPRADPARRRSETGFAQVRLEMVSGVLAQTEQLLLDVQQYPIDEEALMVRAAQRACSSCSCRKNCREHPETLPPALLHRPLGSGSELPPGCRKPGRLLQELRRSQEQLRAIRADRDRQEEYRGAVAQQYRFLSRYLQGLSDLLSRRRTPPKQKFQPELAVCSSSREKVSGDRCIWFAGVECRYYIVLCDGMGTGKEAAREGIRTGNMLKKLLSAGYPPEYALRSVNNLCALQGKAGAVTMDIAELQLDTGKAVLYKWGAAPSYLIAAGESVKIGTATPPPGLSVADGRETVQRLSLRKGEMLVLLSDGAGGEDSLRRALEDAAQPPGELAAQILECSRTESPDDATVAVVRLAPCSLAT